MIMMRGNLRVVNVKMIQSTIKELLAQNVTDLNSSLRSKVTWSNKSIVTLSPVKTMLISTNN